MVYQLLALNVAVNSYDHALLTLLVSNQFVEIKGSVFKKFEKDNLFQITCAGMFVCRPQRVLGLKPCHRHRRTVHARSNVNCRGVS
jgi:Eukaryotic membrane protein family